MRQARAALQRKRDRVKRYGNCAASNNG